MQTRKLTEKKIENERCEEKGKRKIRLIPRDREKHMGIPKSRSINLTNPSLWSSLSKMTPPFPSKSGLPNGEYIMAYICFTENELSFSEDCDFKEFWGNFA